MVATGDMKRKRKKFCPVSKGAQEKRRRQKEEMIAQCDGRCDRGLTWILGKPRGGA